MKTSQLHFSRTCVRTTQSVRRQDAGVNRGIEVRFMTRHTSFSLPLLPHRHWWSFSIIFG